MALRRFIWSCVLGSLCGMTWGGGALAQSYGANVGVSAGPMGQSVPLRIPPLWPSAATSMFGPEGTRRGLEAPMGTQIQLAPSQLTQNDPVCYALRSYGFNARDLESRAPKPSSATDCTPRTAAMMKGAGVSQVK